MSKGKDAERKLSTSPTALPESLERLKLSAEEHSLPPLTEEMAQGCPLLWELLCPRWVPTGRRDGNGKMIKAWEEPLFSLSWSPSAGRYTWAVTLRALNIRVTGQLEGLDGLERKVEACLRDHTTSQKTIRQIDMDR